MVRPFAEGDEVISAELSFIVYRIVGSDLCLTKNRLACYLGRLNFR